MVRVGALQLRVAAEYKWRCNTQSEGSSMATSICEKVKRPPAASAAVMMA